MNPIKFDFSHFDDLVGNGLEHAVFDLENTIVRSNITELYFFIKETRMSSRRSFLIWKYSLMATWGPVYLGLDFLKREWFQRAFYKRFEEFTTKEMAHSSSRHYLEFLQHRFIPYVHDLIFHLKGRGVDIRLLSTSTEPTVAKFGEYFQVPYHCLQIQESPNGCRVDLSELKDFKYKYIKGFDPEVTMSVADSKHDLPVLEYVQYPIVVGNRPERWMRRLKGKLIADGKLIDL